MLCGAEAQSSLTKKDGSTLLAAYLHRSLHLNAIRFRKGVANAATDGSTGFTLRALALALGTDLPFLAYAVICVHFTIMPSGVFEADGLSWLLLQA